MNIVINPTKCSPNSITASNKIAVWISNLLKIPLVDDKNLAKRYSNEKIDRVFIVNGMLGFCDFRDEYKKICDNSKQLTWIGNDYAIKPPKYIKEHNNYERIAQYENFDGIKNHKYLDFNKLLAWSGDKKNYSKEGMFYYGAYRKDRDISFKHWFSESKLPIYISTATKNMKKFQEINKDLKFFKPNGDIRKVLHNFQSSIYIEDEFTHNNLMTPANRFYEVIGSKILLFYDIKSKKTLQHAGFWHDDFSVENIEEVKEKLQDYENLRNKQIEIFDGIDFKKQLTEDFLSII